MYGHDGAGVVIGQLEPEEPNSDHSMLTGRTVRRRVVGVPVGNHATNVAGILVGSALTSGTNARIEGIASGARLFSSGYTQYRRPQNAAELLGAVSWFATHPRADVINMSAGYYDAGTNFLMDESGDMPEALLIDWSVQKYDWLWVQAAGNGGPGAHRITVPGDFFNGLTVGTLGWGGINPSEEYVNVARYSSRGPTRDGRHKPDLVAPGSLIRSAGYVVGDNNAVTGDSFTGGAFVNGDGQPGPQDPFFDLNGDGVRQAGEPYWDTRGAGAYGGAGDRIVGATGIQDRDNNGVIQTQVDGTSFAAPHVAGAAALLNQHANRTGMSNNHLFVKAALLNGASKHVVDPTDGARTWPERPVVGQGNGNPLHDGMGIGALNALAAVRQYKSPGANTDLGLIGRDDILPNQERRWELNRLGQTLKPGSLVTATITWDRDVTLRTGQDPSRVESYDVRPLTDLTLELVKRGTNEVVAVSNSRVDNVEHIYFNVRDEGRYEIRVRNAAGGSKTTYALAVSAGTSDGLAFSVSSGAEGLRPFRGHPFPNDVNALGSAGPAGYRTEGEIFVSSGDGTNMARLSGALGTRSRVGPFNAPPAAPAMIYQNVVGVLGLRPGDDVVGLSWGRDGTGNEKSTLVFSVDPSATGKPGSAVRFQALESPVGGPVDIWPPVNPGGGSPGKEAAGDIFKSARLDKFGKYPALRLDPARDATNLLWKDEGELGLQAPATRGGIDAGSEDDLDALEVDNLRLSVDPDGDGMHNEPVFFSLGQGSESLDAGRDLRPHSIFVSHPRDPRHDGFDFDPTGDFSFRVFADGFRDIGLRPGDVIDDFVLSDLGPGGALEPNGWLDKGLDEMLFSLDFFSESVQDEYRAKPGDIYYTDFQREFDPTRRWTEGGSLFASYDELGLDFFDDLDALDIFAVPEPTSLAILIVTALGLAARRRRTRV